MFRNGLEPWHILIVVVLFVVLFGYKKLPDAARGLGKSLRILKSETKALREEGKDKDVSESTAERREREPDSLEKPAPIADPVKDERHTV
ncbi:Sec-independent protein translocase subunit TatA [Streptomyces sp. SL13]|jgi:sec-independent protein translocase protein TatA|uniref:Sec-independent protein translocase protein TatA n=1 Tax=Streptantibioticus silvisoli TaxID=2705255 RepID=A0AA90K883_9ACTN|nr:Sec-independent protein translocase subunit TatA [Streptantibioticus silvisoli]MDI5962903.1 Sec-independent protein translocase subunit TatA [Streptantibioticus silvisoli]MDI5969733.1 Sec-independent protein translocase subunit TatA [Streptantibioticus silvisoli]